MRVDVGNGILVTVQVAVQASLLRCSIVVLMVYQEIIRTAGFESKSWLCYLCNQPIGTTNMILIMWLSPSGFLTFWCLPCSGYAID